MVRSSLTRSDFSVSDLLRKQYNVTTNKQQTSQKGSKEMHKSMNPIYPSQRGCFIDKRNGKVVVVDYPTWSAKNGKYVQGEFNMPIEDGKESSREFASVEEAKDFCVADNYVICTDPWAPKVEQPRDQEYEN